MKKFLSAGLVTVFALALAVQADEPGSKIKSGLQSGKLIGAFYVTKCSGAEDDGVDVGKNLCYRCKYGGRPMVMVFTKTTGKHIESLVQGLDKTVAQHKKDELKAFVNLLGDNKKKLQTTAKQLNDKTKTKAIPFVVPNEFKNGPENYGLNPKAEVTVIIASGGKVVANHAFTKGKLDDAAVKAILKDIAKAI